MDNRSYYSGITFFVKSSCAFFLANIGDLTDATNAFSLKSSLNYGGVNDFYLLPRIDLEKNRIRNKIANIPKKSYTKNIYISNILIWNQKNLIPNRI